MRRAILYILAGVIVYGFIAIPVYLVLYEKGVPLFVSMAVNYMLAAIIFGPIFVAHPDRTGE